MKKVILASAIAGTVLAATRTDVRSYVSDKVTTFLSWLVGGEKNVREKTKPETEEKTKPETDKKNEYTSYIYIWKL